MSPHPVAARDLQFAMIAERGALERQVLMLAESIRLLGDGWRDAAICVLSPRATRRPQRSTLQRLEQLGVEFLALDVASPCPAYGTSWRMAAMAALESRAGPPYLLMLDSDTVFLAPPTLTLHPRAVAARPVDVRGICSRGRDDAVDDYWQRLCALCGVDYDAVPWVETTVGAERVKASHNGGFVATARHHGLFARAFEFLARCSAAGLAPRSAAPGAFRTGTGEAHGDAARLWGSAQTTLTMAMVSLGLEQQLLPPSYNVPLHLFEAVHARFPEVATDPVHAHYHWLCERDALAQNPLLDGRMRVPDTVAALLQRHLPIDPD